MSEKEALELIFTLREDIWKNWGYLITFNIAMWGWLIHRHGLYGISEKLVATTGYTFFVLMLVSGLHKSYIELDYAANELAYNYSKNIELINTKTTNIQDNDITKKMKAFVSGGIVEYFLSKSPRYCSEIPKIQFDCNKYSNNFKFPLKGLFIAWLFSLVLFWMDAFWLKARIISKHKA